MTSPVRRKSRFPNRLALVVLGIVIVLLLWPAKPSADPSHVQSGDHTLTAINSDASLRISIPIDDSDSKLSPLDVRWLGITFTQPGKATEWLRRELDQVEKISLRLDRRRLDESGNLQAYFYVEERLLNAELVRQGFAEEDTHPSDFAPISRQIRNAKELQHPALP